MVLRAVVLAVVFTATGLATARAAEPGGGDGDASEQKAVEVERVRVSFAEGVDRYGRPQAPGPRSFRARFHRTIPLGRPFQLVGRVPRKVLAARVQYWRAWPDDTECARMDEPRTELETKVEAKGGEFELTAGTGYVTEPWWRTCFEFEVWVGEPEALSDAEVEAVVGEAYRTVTALGKLDPAGLAEVVEEVLGLGGSCDGQARWDHVVLCRAAARKAAERLLLDERLEDALQAMQNTNKAARRLWRSVAVLRGDLPGLPPPSDRPVEALTAGRVGLDDAVVQACGAGVRERSAAWSVEDDQLKAELAAEGADALGDEAKAKALARRAEIQRLRNVAGDWETACAELTGAGGPVKRLEAAFQAMKTTGANPGLRILRGYHGEMARDGRPLEERVGFFFSTDIGVGVMAGTLYGQAFVSPMVYGLLSLSFAPVDFHHTLGDIRPPRGDRGTELSDWNAGQRLTLSLGVAYRIGEVAVDGGELEGPQLGNGSDPMGLVALGVRLSEWTKVSVGLALGSSKRDAIPGAQRELVPAFFIGVSIDVPTYRLIGSAFTEPQIQATFTPTIPKIDKPVTPAR